MKSSVSASISEELLDPLSMGVPPLLLALAVVPSAVSGTSPAATLRLRKLAPLSGTLRRCLGLAKSMPWGSCAMIASDAVDGS